ncbi:MAG TPA: hypothetical protein VFJ47_01690, partial [Terriglobales bacterium]|nr:hypothetical protein [Terriglobales bacterium]
MSNIAPKSRIGEINFPNFDQPFTIATSIFKRGHPMRKIMCTVILFFVASLLARSQNQDFSKVQMKVSKVAGNIYMLEGEGGNIGASVGEDG